MVTAKESWPPVTKNIITMRPIQSPDNASTSQTTKSYNTSVIDKIQWFAFEHSQYYQSVQNLFLTALERTDSDFLINLIRKCPYHVDSLIQLSELCKFMLKKNDFLYIYTYMFKIILYLIIILKVK